MVQDVFVLDVFLKASLPTPYNWVAITLVMESKWLSIMIVKGGIKDNLLHH